MQPILLSTVYSEFFNWSNFECRSIQSNNGFFRREFEAQAHFLGYLLAKLRVVLQLGIAVCYRLPRVAMPERDEVLRDQVLAKPCNAETTERVTTSLAAQDVRLCELPTSPIAEEQARLSLANEILEHLRHRWV